MRRILGASCVSCLVGVIGMSAAALGGYSVMTGKTVCSVLHGCPESAAKKNTEAQVVQVSNKEGEQKAGGCCALAGLAKKGACSGEAKVAKAKAGDVIAVAGSVPVVIPAMYYNPAVQVTEKDLASGGCSEAKSSCCKSKAEGQVVQAKATAGDSGCCKGSGKRADGEACKKDGDHCTKGAGEQAEKKPEADKKGEPVASRN